MSSASSQAEPLVVLDLSHQAQGLAIIRLNRPKALQALNTEMVLELKAHFLTLAKDGAIKAIWLESSTPKAFCAGGDVRAVRASVLENDFADADGFFAAEYELDLLLHEYAKPIIAWGDGYVMGGGLGLMMACPFRIITPDTKCAMPEVQIGLFPDVGASRFLSERKRIGLFLGLTGSMLAAADIFAIRWATHISSLPRQEVLERVLGIDWASHASAQTAIADCLTAIHKPLAAESLQESLDSINGLCRGEDFAVDYQNLKNLVEAQKPWLKAAGENVAGGAPSTVALTWLLWQWGKAKSWQEVFTLEYELVKWKIRHPDFAEGVRARLIDKDLSPSWQHTQSTVLNDILPSLPETNDADWQALLTQYGIQPVADA